MRGTKHLTVQSAHLKYEMVFSRNITILKGDSATGKTTLIDMIQEYILNGSDTGIQLSCDCPCSVLAGSTWMTQLANIHNSLVFIDEGNRFVASSDFAKAVAGSDNYYVIVTREGLNNLPYSVTEIYGIHSSGKYAYQEPVYHHMYRIYGNYQQLDDISASELLVEDSNSGYEFFSAVSSGTGLGCRSAKGAGNIFAVLNDSELKDSIIVIADGAAFGAQMEKVYQLTLRNPNIRLYLPESFEWIILSSGIINDGEVRRVLSNPSEYVESKDFFSWERFFTKLLVSKTENTFMKYSKDRLNPVFLQGKYCEDILAVLPKAIRDALKQAH